ncbi:RHS repeat-associated core domain-containing protein [Chryseobacterium shandongense]|nr:RHS repeat-associated core domain-containing protein [Chryseobacterium shandongense]
MYNYFDHLGNVRLSYFNNGSGIEVLEENNYYPFGLKHEGYNALAGNPSYHYKYNGKELQETGMYDYGARFYMPDIGRWGVVDPNQESYTNHSPYNYVGNNPIMRIDPDGRDWYYTGDGQYLYNKDLNRNNATQFFKDNNIEGARYAFASNTMGFMNYAADGYIYDDSAAGGGKPIENGRLNNIEGVTVTKTNWWNSPLARFLVPDRFGVTTGTSAGGGFEVGASMGFEVITRGKDAGVYFDPGTFSAESYLESAEK